MEFSIGSQISYSAKRCSGGIPTLSMMHNAAKSSSFQAVTGVSEHTQTVCKSSSF